jgi:predicted phosphodiesterase/5-methylcytosine-specific restriction endonuclease McrA
MCGCGIRVKKHPWKKNVWNKYILGHVRRGAVFTDQHRKHLSENKKAFYNKTVKASKQCDCGCGEWTKPGNNFVLGHNRKNEVFSEEHRSKISSMKKGIPVPIERRKQISETLKKFYSNKENHPQWKGGVSTELYGELFNASLKELVRTKYNRTCQICGKSEIELKVKLSIHHIDYNKQNNDLDNLIPLCVKCHTKTNSKRIYWERRLKNMIQRIEQNFEKIILMADIHLREDIPICRMDNIIDVEIKKLQFVKDLQKEQQCPVVVAGDLFHHWKPSPYLLTIAMKHLPENLWVIAGNHDLPQHSMNLLDKSGLYTLVHAGKVRFLRGTHWGQIPEEPSLIFKTNNGEVRKILVWHTMTYTDKEPYPNCPDPPAIKLLKKYPEYDLIVTGDNHETFVEEYQGRLLVNPGSLMRMTAAQINHRPCVFLWYANTNTVEPVYLPIENDVVSREHIAKTEQRNERIDAFISRLDGDWKVATSFEENLKRFEKANQIRQSVMDIVYKSIE